MLICHLAEAIQVAGVNLMLPALYEETHVWMKTDQENGQEVLHIGGERVP